jgi:hypothetical protein
VIITDVDPALVPADVVHAVWELSAPFVPYVDFDVERVGEECRVTSKDLIVAKNLPSAKPQKGTEFNSLLAQRILFVTRSRYDVLHGTQTKVD